MPENAKQLFYRIGMYDEYKTFGEFDVLNGSNLLLPITSIIRSLPIMEFLLISDRRFTIAELRAHSEDASCCFVGQSDVSQVVLCLSNCTKP
jgi:hypothetical protein